MINWLLNTCLLGLIPSISRLLVWIVAKNGVDPIAISDLVAFGLVLHIVSINDLSSMSIQDSASKVTHISLSTLFVVLYGLMMFTAIVPSSVIDYRALTNACIFLCCMSFLLSLSAKRLSIASGTAG